MPGKKILITGAAGMLGSDVLKLFNEASAGNHFQVIGTTRKECDLADRESLNQLLAGIRPDLVIHCAAYTDVDGCEGQREKAFTANAGVAGNLAEALGKLGSRLFYISTDYVFSGEKISPYTEDDPASPLSVYGRSKLEGEISVLTLGDKGTVIRASWLFGHNGRNFVKAILAKARSEGKLRVVDDQRGSPTYTKDLAGGILNLTRLDASGIYHLTNSGDCTWFAFAREIVDQAGLDGIEITPITTEQIGRPARRPKNSVLSCGKYSALAGKPMRHWREALREYLALDTPRPSATPLKRGICFYPPAL
ncbi:MAG: dTDP-4-dehydrorhamnose reductase [Nitrospinae bacterium]|nr:dTDP-4-dehydrorhamnose reductase [Nitrospinota bacterium]